LPFLPLSSGYTRYTSLRALAIRALRETVTFSPDRLHYNVARAALLLEGIARLSPAALEESLPALAHGDVFRSRSRARRRLPFFFASLALTPPPARIPRLGRRLPPPLATAS